MEALKNKVGQIRITPRLLMNFSFLMLVIIIYIFNFQIDTDGNVFTNIAILLFCLIEAAYLLFNMSKFRFPYLFISLSLFVLMSYFSLTYSVIYSQSILKANTLLLNLFFVFFLIQFLLDKENMKYAFNFMLIAGTIASIYVLFNYEWGSGDRASNIIGNANTVAIYLVYTSTIAMYHIFYSKNKLLYILSFIVQVINIFLTGSRTALVLLLLGILLVMVIGSYRYKLSKIIRNTFVAASLMVVLVISVFTIEPLYNLVGSRIESFFYIISGNEYLTTEASTIERFQMFNIGLRVFLEKPLFGCGIGGIGYYIEQEIGRYTFSHNNYIELLSSVGIVGFLFYYSIHFISLKKLITIRRKTKNMDLDLSLIILLLILFSHIGIVHYYYKLEFIYLTIICCAPLVYNTKNSNLPEKNHE